MEDQALGFLLLMVILLGLGTILSMARETPKQEACSVHDWSYNKDNKLQCCKCNMVAGQTKTDNGEY